MIILNSPLIHCTNNQLQDQSLIALFRGCISTVVDPILIMINYIINDPLLLMLSIIIDPLVLMLFIINVPLILLMIKYPLLLIRDPS